MKVCRVTEIRELDRRAIENYGIPAEILMENAGSAAAHVIKKETGIKGHQFAVICGPGNNGGDGFVVARHLHAAGGTVRILLLASREKYRGEARQNLQIVEKIASSSKSNQPSSFRIRDIKSSSQLEDEMSGCDVVVDAILGTGLDRNVEGLLRVAIGLVNGSGNRVFALDIPSGVNGDSGQVMGEAIKADATITFGLPKIGNLLFPGYGQGGKLFVAPISYPQALSHSETLKVEVPEPSVLPLRRADTNKMSYGPVLVIAGAANYFWAPHASAYSFLKAGGGYVFLACPGSLAASVARKGKEVVIQPQEETASGSIALSNKGKLLELAKRMRMVIIGPGLSLDEQTQQLVRELSGEIENPLLIDGDGITAVAKTTDIIRQRRAPTIMTPHAGEMARITGRTHEEIEKNRVTILQQTSSSMKAHIVLKGPHSLIGSPDGRVSINISGSTEGQAGMATAGAGDVLNGTIAAMYCLGLKIPEAVLTGVFIHGLSGDISARKKGADGMTAQDILNNLPDAVRYYRENIEDITGSYHGVVHLAN